MLCTLPVAGVFCYTRGKMREKLLTLSKKTFEYKPLENPLFPPSAYYRFLMLLAQELKPNLSVELGVCGGGGSLHLALGNPNGVTIGIDIATIPELQFLSIKSQVDNFIFWQGDSTRSAKNIYEKYGEVGILFIDTTHTTEQTIAEYEAWKPYLSDNAIVCFDDLFRQEMKGYWESLPEPKLRLDELHSGAERGGGFGVIWKE